MTLILILALSLALAASLGVIVAQRQVIEHQRRKLIEALDWIEPEEIVLPEDWET